MNSQRTAGDAEDSPLESLRLSTTEAVRERRLPSRKIQKRQRHFVRVPWTWIERLGGADGQTYRVALYLLYLHWKGNGAPVKLASGMLNMDGVPRETKRRALLDLERRGLAVIMLDVTRF
jgi:hypothetical protein